MFWRSFSSKSMDIYMSMLWKSDQWISQTVFSLGKTSVIDKTNDNESADHERVPPRPK